MKKINCILLVDDNPADNYYHEFIIRDADICNHIKTVLSSDKALEYLRLSGEPGRSVSFPVPDVIFLDINMPRMNGFEFLDEYKKMDERLKSKVIVVMLTTSLNPEDRIRAMETKEVKEFIIKPLTTELISELSDKYF